MTSEAQLWSTVKRHLSPHGQFVRIESPLTERGIPDVAYCVRGVTGWLELKELDTWPKRTTTPLRVGHLTLEQMLFLEEWERNLGSAYGLLQVERDYLLLSVAQVRRVHERLATRAELITEALAFGTGKFPALEVIAALTGAPGRTTGAVAARERALARPRVERAKGDWTP